MTGQETARKDAYDRASLALTNMVAAARLLIENCQSDSDEQSFLLTSILDNAEKATEGLGVLSPYGASHG